ncbi:Crp/Fnr family transcriptional regulator [Tenacibaculum ovolyticum]|jgi:CRP/FNR family transcriptional regulator|uniref:Crp/Fnr family transcriptional regulator n=1 Tax=Tenacibaculum ovolyticum TaxID=104270 RepID=UPI001F409866|nr:Crp/Fnr family transcriptional regulator [Tenacibaculum ovolyticum]WBX77916.1 Crp/Fnr family transcriptional regulator [Tenacibaculum ovolyticum]
MTEFNQLFKALNIAEVNLKEEILKVGIIQTVPKNTFIVEQGKYIKWLALVISGKVRVWQENDDRQILLYYVNPIQTCVLSLSATFRDYKSLVNAKTEEDTIIIKIPVRFVSEWSFKYKSWNNFTTNSFIFSYDDLLHSYKNLAFNKIDKRLIDYLKLESTKKQSHIINLSHSQLAKEIGTTREVVSKILKQFEVSGIVKLKFKQIELL